MIKEIKKLEQKFKDFQNTYWGSLQYLNLQEQDEIIYMQEELKDIEAKIEALKDMHKYFIKPFDGPQRLLHTHKSDINDRKLRYIVNLIEVESSNIDLDIHTHKTLLKDFVERAKSSKS